MAQQYSDEFINSYLDNELGHDDRKELLNAIRHDRKLSNQVCKLKNVKDMVQLAYQIDTNTTVNNKNSIFKQWQTIAASILLIFGVTIGWLANDITSQPRLSDIAKNIHFSTAGKGAQTSKNWRLVLHVSSNDSKRYNILLNEAESLLKTSLENNESVQIELLTNGPGLAILEDKNSAISKRVNALADKYDNFTLLACKKALKRLKDEKGINLKLVPETETVESALHHAIQRQKEGWSYIQI